MAQKISFGTLFVGKVPEVAPASHEEQGDTPLRVLILGKFSGRASDSAALRPVAVDRDNLDAVLAKLKPTVTLPGIHPDGSAVEIAFEELDDFHPDRVFERLPLFDSLRDTRSRLQSQKTYAAAAAEVRSWAAARAAVPPEEPHARLGDTVCSTPAAAPTEPAAEGNLLDNLLDQSEGSYQKAATTRKSGVFDELLAHVAGRYQIEADDPAKQELTDLVDELISDRMRAILHRPEFQALESVWRGVDFLTRRVETDTSLKLSLLDLSKEQLASDLAAVEQLRSSKLYKLLVDLPAGTPPWGIVVGIYQFGSSRDDVELLGRVAQIASRAGAPFLAAADPQVFGGGSLADRPDPDDWDEPDAAGTEMWQQLRHLPEAAWLGLAAPRILLRMPYGHDTSPTERFEFDELPAPDHAGYLWGNPAIAWAMVLARGFSADGWDLVDNLDPDVDELPLHVYDDDGQSHIKPCAEALLTDRATEQILGSGIAPLQSFADRGTFRLFRMQSLADPPTALAGRWNRG
jgi:type VI secretion system protein ImpC